MMRGHVKISGLSLRRLNSIVRAIVLMALCTLRTLLPAQSTSQVADTLDYSYLSFIDLHSYYQSKDINIIEAEDPNLYFEAYAWLGTPYRWGGKSKSGTDCSGFASSVYNRLYGTDLGGSAGDIFKKCDPVLPSELKEGDFVFFNINGHYLYHVGIYLQNGKFAHAAVHGGVMVSSLDEPYYKRWFYKAARLRPTQDTDSPAEATSP